MSRIKNQSLNILRKKYTYEEIKSLYMAAKIYLKDKELEKVCKNTKDHGGCNTK